MEKRSNIFEKIGPKRIAIFLGIVFAIIIIYSVATLLARIGKVPVKIEYAPFASTVKLNDTRMRNNAENYITPGKYTLTVEFENFESIEKEVEITENTIYLAGSLKPINSLGEEYMASHQEEFNIIKRQADEVNSAANKKFFETYQLLVDFPIVDPQYTISYTLSDESKPIINVAAGTAYRQLAVHKLLSIMSSEDFGLYDIFFENLDNPFTDTFKNNQESDPAEFIKKGFSDTGIDFSVNEDKKREDDGYEDYYYAYIRYFYNTYISVIYRIVLVKDGNSWKLAANPYPLLTTANTPEVPLEIINRVNSL